MDALNELKNVDNDHNVVIDSSVKVICLDLDETLIRATRVACNNTGSKLLKYWGQRVAECREKELRKLLQDKPKDCTLTNQEYLDATYGPPLFESNPDVASPYLWSFPTDDFSNCWTLIRCYNPSHKITSFYRIEYRPYCQHLIEVINKYKKHCKVKVVISTMATRQYGSLVCEGFKLFKGYFETINDVSTPFIDEFIGLEDWRENCWSKQYPQFYGKKSLAYIGVLFGINPSHVIAIDDKPQIWTNVKQVIYAMPYNGGIHLKEDDKNVHNSNNDNKNINKIDDILYKIAKYFESYLHQALSVLSKQKRSNQNVVKLQLKLQTSNSSARSNNSNTKHSTPVVDNKSNQSTPISQNNSTNMSNTSNNNKKIHDYM